MIDIFAVETYFKWGDGSIQGVINLITTFLAGAVGVVAVAGIIYGGIMYSLAMGDKAKVSKAIKIIVNCAIAIVLAALWGVIQWFVGMPRP